MRTRLPLFLAFAVLVGALLPIGSPLRAEIGLERLRLCPGVRLRRAAEPGSALRRTAPTGGQPVEVLVRQWTTMQVLLPDGVRAWVDDDACFTGPAPETPTRLRLARLRVRARSRRYPELPGEVRTWELRDAGAVVLVVSARVGPGTDLRPGVMVAPFHDALRPGKERLFRLSRSPRARAALAAVNGTYFELRRGEEGLPLGKVVEGGRVRFRPEDESLSVRRRTALSWSRARGLELREDPPPDAEMLLGGLGRLARAGLPSAWQEHVDRQFHASFYSTWTRRARSLVGIGEGGRRLYLAAQEDAGRTARPLSLPELSHLLVRLGARDVAFLDGGSSTELLFRGRPLVRGGREGISRRVSTALLLEDEPGRGRR